MKNEQIRGLLFLGVTEVEFNKLCLTHYGELCMDLPTHHWFSRSLLPCWSQEFNRLSNAWVDSLSWDNESQTYQGLITHPEDEHASVYLLGLDDGKGDYLFWFQVWMRNAVDQLEIPEELKEAITRETRQD